MEVKTGADGKFTATFKVPSLAARDSADPAHPKMHALEARLIQEVGPLRTTENFGDLLGKTVNGTPPLNSTAQSSVSLE